MRASAEGRRGLFNFRALSPTLPKARKLQHKCLTIPYDGALFKRDPATCRQPLLRRTLQLKHTSPRRASPKTGNPSSLQGGGIFIDKLDALRASPLGKGAIGNCWAKGPAVFGIRSLRRHGRISGPGTSGSFGWVGGVRVAYRDFYG